MSPKTQAACDIPVKPRLYWPGMEKYITLNLIVLDAHFGRDLQKAPLDLVRIDYLKKKSSEGGYKNVLVITVHFPRYAQGIPTRNQSAATAARVLFEQFFVHYGFPGKPHSDQGANWNQTALPTVRNHKTSTTPYHPIGNGL